MSALASTASGALLGVTNGGLAFVRKIREFWTNRLWLRQPQEKYPDSADAWSVRRGVCGFTLLLIILQAAVFVAFYIGRWSTTDRMFRPATHPDEPYTIEVSDCTVDVRCADNTLDLFPFKQRLKYVVEHANGAVIAGDRTRMCRVHMCLSTLPSNLTVHMERSVFVMDLDSAQHTGTVDVFAAPLSIVYETFEANKVLLAHTRFTAPVFVELHSGVLFVDDVRTQGEHAHIAAAVSSGPVIVKTPMDAAVPYMVRADVPEESYCVADAAHATMSTTGSTVPGSVNYTFTNDATLHPSQYAMRAGIVAQSIYVINADPLDPSENRQRQIAGAEIGAASQTIDPTVVAALNATDHWIAGLSWKDAIQAVEVVTPDIGMLLLSTNRPLFLEFGPALMASFSFYVLQPSYRRFVVTPGAYGCPTNATADAFTFLTAGTLSSPFKSSSAGVTTAELQSRLDFYLPLAARASFYDDVTKLVSGIPGMMQAVNSDVDTFHPQTTTPLHTFTRKRHRVIESLVHTSPWLVVLMALSYVVGAVIVVSLVFVAVANAGTLIEQLMLRRERLGIRLMLKTPPPCSYTDYMATHTLLVWLSYRALRLFDCKMLAMSSSTFWLKRVVAKFFKASAKAKQDENGGKKPKSPAAAAPRTAMSITEMMHTYHLWADANRITVPPLDTTAVTGVFGSANIAMDPYTKVPVAVGLAHAPANGRPAFNDAFRVTGRDGDEVPLNEIQKADKEQAASLDSIKNALEGFNVKVKEENVEGVLLLTSELRKMDAGIELSIARTEHVHGTVPYYTGGFGGIIGFFMLIRHAVVLTVFSWVGPAIVIGLQLQSSAQRVRYTLSTDIASPLGFPDFVFFFYNDWLPMPTTTSNALYWMALGYAMTAVLELLLHLLDRTVMCFTVPQPGTHGCATIQRLVLRPLAVASSVLCFGMLILVWAVILTEVIIAMIWWVLGSVIAPHRMLSFATCVIAVGSTVFGIAHTLHTSRQRVEKELEAKVIQELTALLKSASAAVGVSGIDSKFGSGGGGGMAAVNIGLLAKVAAGDHAAIIELAEATQIPAPFISFCLAAQKRSADDMRAALIPLFGKLGIPSVLADGAAFATARALHVPVSADDAFLVIVDVLKQLNKTALLHAVHQYRSTVIQLVEACINHSPKAAEQALLHAGITLFVTHVLDTNGDVPHAHELIEHMEEMVTQVHHHDVKGLVVSSGLIAKAIYAATEHGTVEQISNAIAECVDDFSQGYGTKMGVEYIPNEFIGGALEELYDSCTAQGPLMLIEGARDVIHELTQLTPSAVARLRALFGVALAAKVTEEQYRSLCEYSSQPPKGFTRFADMAGKIAAGAAMTTPTDTTELSATEQEFWDILRFIRYARRIRRGILSVPAIEWAEDDDFYSESTLFDRTYIFEAFYGVFDEIFAKVKAGVGKQVPEARHASLKFALLKMIVTEQEVLAACMPWLVEVQHADFHAANKTKVPNVAGCFSFRFFSGSIVIAAESDDPLSLLREATSRVLVLLTTPKKASFPKRWTRLNVAAFKALADLPGVPPLVAQHLKLWLPPVASLAMSTGTAGAPSGDAVAAAAAEAHLGRDAVAAMLRPSQLLADGAARLLADLTSGHCTAKRYRLHEGYKRMHELLKQNPAEDEIRVKLSTFAEDPRDTNNLDALKPLFMGPNAGTFVAVSQVFKLLTGELDTVADIPQVLKDRMASTVGVTTPDQQAAFFFCLKIFCCTSDATQPTDLKNPIHVALHARALMTKHTAHMAAPFSDSSPTGSVFRRLAQEAALRQKLDSEHVEGSLQRLLENPLDEKSVAAASLVTTLFLDPIADIAYELRKTATDAGAPTAVVTVAEAAQPGRKRTPRTARPGAGDAEAATDDQEMRSRPRAAPHTGREDEEPLLLNEAPDDREAGEATAEGDGDAAADANAEGYVPPEQPAATDAQPHAAADAPATTTTATADAANDDAADTDAAAAAADDEPEPESPTTDAMAMSSSMRIAKAVKDVNERSTDVTNPVALAAVMLLRHNYVRARELIAKAIITSPEAKELANNALEEVEREADEADGSSGSADAGAELLCKVAPIVGSLFTLQLRCSAVDTGVARNDETMRADAFRDLAYGTIGLVRDTLEADGRTELVEEMNAMLIGVELILEARWPTEEEFDAVEAAVRRLLAAHVHDEARLNDTCAVVRALFEFTATLHSESDDSATPSIVGNLVTELVKVADPSMETLSEDMTLALEQLFKVEPPQRLPILLKLGLTLIKSACQAAEKPKSSDASANAMTDAEHAAGLHLSASAARNIMLVMDLSQGKYSVLEPLLKQCGVHLENEDIAHDVATVMKIVASFAKRGRFVSAHDAAKDFVDACINQIFDEFADSTGVISFTTFKSIFKRLHIEISTHEAKTLFAHADENGNGSIDRTEFRATIMELQARFRHKAMEALHLSTANIVLGVLWVLFVLVLFLGFLMIGVVMLADGTTFTSVITGMLPGLGKAVGFLSAPAGLDLLVHRGEAVVTVMFAKLTRGG